MTRGHCSKCDKITRHCVNNSWLCVFCEMALEDKLSDNEEEFIELIRKSRLTKDEIALLLRSRKPVFTKPVQRQHFGKDKIRIGIVPDLHIGSKYFNEPAYHAMVQKFTDEKVDAVYSVGDLIEGMSGRDGHVFELEDIGYTAQLNHAIRLLKIIKQPFLFIQGNHDMWARNKANAGLDIGQEVERRLPNSRYLGEMEATVEVAPNIRLRLTHRGNSSTYALSYSGQRMINNIAREQDLPQILINGHLHKAIYMQYRGIHYLEAGTLQEQTEFMKLKGAPANVGFWIVEIEKDKKGLTGFRPCWYPIR